MPSLRAAALSEIGQVRRENEDRFICNEGLGVFGVADGVGGLPGGGEAATLAIECITAAITPSNGNAEPNLFEIAQEANRAVLALGAQISPATGIGTTLTFGCVRSGMMRLAHVGDSRCYLSRDQEFVRVTEDHSVENDARLRRARGEVVYYHDANRNALTRCIGQPTRLEVDLINRPLMANDRYLFCTDGVTRLLTDRELSEVLRKRDSPRTSAEEIVAAALARGGLDNVTVVAVFIDSL